jgi:hypothetical protein
VLMGLEPMDLGERPAERDRHRRHEEQSPQRPPSHSLARDARGVPFREKSAARVLAVLAPRQQCQGRCAVLCRAVQTGWRIGMGRRYAAKMLEAQGR